MAVPVVGVIMGSQSDWATLRHAAAVLDEFGIAHERRIVSAHRTPHRLVDYAAGARGRGLKVIIAGAGGAAHRPGMVAALTSPAVRRGYRTVILTPETEAPASQVTDRTILAEYDNYEALTRFAELVDVATYEFENVPVEPVIWLAERIPVRPGARVLRIAQDRLRE